MSKIVVELNPNSIQKAINQLKSYKKALPLMMNELLEFACEWIIRRANFYIDNADLGSLVAMQLKNAWEYEISNGYAKVTNRLNAKRIVGVGENRETVTVPLSVLIEFGVGVVGQSQAHPNASKEGYQYNVPSPSKSSDGSWTFFADREELDLPSNSYSIGGSRKGGESGERLIITTQGTEGVMYAYNAIVDANVDLQNPNGAFSTEWRRIKERYLG
jgi:hypothetical protein